MDILKELLDLREEEYADFQSRLTPGIESLPGFSRKLRHLKNF